MLSSYPPPFGGISVHARRLANGLESCGWTVELLAAGRQNPNVDDVQAHFIGNSILRHAVAVAQSKAPILHVHDRLSILTLVACLVARLRGKRIVLTEHGIPRRLFRRTDGVDIFLRASIQLADQVVAVSEHVERRLSPYTRRPIRVCAAYLPPTSRELSDIRGDIAHWLQRSGDAPIVTLLVTRLLPPGFRRQDVYGLRVARRAVLKLARSKLRFRFAILLSTAPKGLEEVQFWTHETNLLHMALGDQFGTFTGAFAPPLLGRTDVLLRPTLSDGDAVSIREALDLGCRVIASDVAPRPAGTIIYPEADCSQLPSLIATALRQTTNRVDKMSSVPRGLQWHIEMYESLIGCDPRCSATL